MYFPSYNLDRVKKFNLHALFYIFLIKKGHFHNQPILTVIKFGSLDIERH